MTFDEFFAALPYAIQRVEATDVRGQSMEMPASLSRAKAMFANAHALGRKVVFVGNGGSGAIASHMAIDYTKNGGIRAVALNDHPTLTCIANDFGYEQVFAKQIEFYGHNQDVVVIISSSGKSGNILEAAKAARMKACGVVTLSGMRPQNKLRRMGDLNFYVPSEDYGIVEISHLSLLHSIVSTQ